MIKSCRDAQLDSHETSYLVADEEFLPVKERELRIACTFAHMEREGGISLRLSPDAWNLLTRAGFCLPGVDVDEYVVKYKSEHLRAMGETNALLQRNKLGMLFFLSSILNREIALATAAIYDSMFATEDGTIPATFQAKRRGSDIQKTRSNWGMYLEGTFRKKQRLYKGDWENQ
ncbi:hypothetical protein YC2023_090189 [Brassica napus]